MGELVTKSSNNRIVNKTEVPAGKHLVMCVAKGTVIGDEPRVLAAITESKDFVFAQMTLGEGIGDLRLFERVAGKDYQVGSTQRLGNINAGEWFTLAVCCDNGNVAAMASNQMGETVRCRGVSKVAGTRTGLGTGNVTDTVRFDRILCKKHYPASCTKHPRTSEAGCPTCGQTCPCCQVTVLDK